jgi:thiol-disulfide isomerase/thioredoxin
MMHIRLCAILFLVAILLAGCGGPLSPTAPRKLPDVGPPKLSAPCEPAPPLEGEDAGGRALNLKDYRGKVVLLTFWRTDCPPCRAFHLRERALAYQYDGKPFALLGVNFDQDPDKCRGTQVREKMFWPSLVDDVSVAATEWRVDLTPTIFLIDAQGDLRYTSRGVAPPEEKDLKRLIDELLAEIK